VLDTLYDVSSTSTGRISSATGRLSQRAAWRTVGETKMYPFHLQPVQGM